MKAVAAFQGADLVISFCLSGQQRCFDSSCGCHLDRNPRGLLITNPHLKGTVLENTKVFGLMNSCNAGESSLDVDFTVLNSLFMARDCSRADISVLC